MLAPSFRQSVGCRIEPGLACLGRFEGDEPLLAVATGGNRVLLHSSARVGGTAGPPRFLNLSCEVTSIQCARLDPRHPGRDILLVGSPSSLLAYDVHDNSDRFFVQVPEGVHTVAHGNLHNSQPALTFVGGNCSLQGFDAEGNESFWTVIGGTASSLAFCDADRDGRQELLVGSDDFEIRAFQSEESAFEITETEAISHLCPFPRHSSRFAYGLTNGTIGVYDGQTRVWRVKAKGQVLAMTVFDIDGDGEDELITGWSNGKLEARRHDDGEVVYRETLDCPISVLVTGDFRNAGVQELICCLASGEVRGYSSATSVSELGALGVATGGVPIANDTAFGTAPGRASPTSSAGQVMDAIKNAHRASSPKANAHLSAEADEDFGPASALLTAPSQTNVHERRDPRLARLQEQLTLKMLELQGLEESLAKAKTGSLSRPVGMLPDGASVALRLDTNLASGCLEIHAKVSADCTVQNLLLFAPDAGVFPTEYFVGTPEKRSQSEAVARFVPLKHTPATLAVQTFVSARGTTEHVHVFQETVALARFARLAIDESAELGAEAGSADYRVDGVCLEAVLGAVEQMVGSGVDLPGLPAAGGELKVPLVDVASKFKLVLLARQDGSNSLAMRLSCDDLQLAADFVQELAAQLGLHELEASVDFPREMRQLEGLMEQVSELNSIRQRLGAEMADESMYIKNLIVRAEDARVLADVANITTTYQELTTLNMQLIGEYNKRANNQARLLESLRTVHQIIQQASRLRVGKPQAEVVAASRKAIKASNLPGLFHALTSC